MVKEPTTFKRIEKKYLITDLQYNWIIDEILAHTNPDSHKRCTVFSVYFDTPDYRLIRRSLDKPVYKEKLRLRTYGVPADDSCAFLEIKKKCKKVVYKRRVEMKYRDALSFIATHQLPAGFQLPVDFDGKSLETRKAQDLLQASRNDRQILNEISWFLHVYPDLAPRMLISYDRAAYYGTTDKNLRITFDTNLLWRDDPADPTKGVWGTRLLDDGLRLMEIKVNGAMPLWLAQLLNETRIFPTSFSKYGTAFTQKLLKGEIKYA
ncbi:MAG: polyphosphate polymerase domain-containing protein [Bacillota bacterium]|nr:polyphosphate polymerase domain-containing protein [Bacillota bacterium]